MCSLIYFLIEIDNYRKVLQDPPYSEFLASNQQKDFNSRLKSENKNYLYGAGFGAGVGSPKKPIMQSSKFPVVKGNRDSSIEKSFPKFMPSYQQHSQSSDPAHSSNQHISVNKYTKPFNFPFNPNKKHEFKISTPTKAKNKMIPANCSPLDLNKKPTYLIGNTYACFLIYT
jgi:hypothetical protein